MRKLSIITYKQRVGSGTKTWIATISEENKVQEFLGIIYKEDGDRWVEYKGELEEGTVVKVCYTGSYSGKNKSYYRFTVGDEIQENMADIVKYL